MNNIWQEQVKKWTNNVNSLKEYDLEFDLFFSKIINLAYYPERAFFSSDKNTISVVIGHLYVGVYIHSGENEGIGMIVEKDFTDIHGIKCSPVKSTLASTSKHKLFWLWIKELPNLKNILNNQSVWDSFKLASELVIETPQGKYTREREQKNKISLAELITPKEIVDEREYLQVLQDKVEEAKKLSRENRLKKLLESPERPERISIISIGFKRNSLVIAEVIKRANGICELCKKAGPFIKLKDEIPFLEVHHIEPLSEGGKDIVKNAVGLCPNCHREAHYGMNNQEIRKKLKQYIKNLSKK
jgi:5-methylcytosine-specific restriction endonuclease McrA